MPQVVHYICTWISLWTTQRQIRLGHIFHNTFAVAGECWCICFRLCCPWIIINSQTRQTYQTNQSPKDLVHQSAIPLIQARHSRFFSRWHRFCWLVLHSAFGRSSSSRPCKVFFNTELHGATRRTLDCQKGLLVRSLKPMWIVRYARYTRGTSSLEYSSGRQVGCSQFHWRENRCHRRKETRFDARFAQNQRRCYVAANADVVQIVRCTLVQRSQPQAPPWQRRGRLILLLLLALLFLQLLLLLCNVVV